MQDYYDFTVIGGGASGMAAAVTAASYGDRVLLIEKNNSLGRKISASGNGRCNLMNSGKNRYWGDSLFAEKILNSFPFESLIHFWNEIGILLTEENEGRMYPCTFQSSTVTDAYKTVLRISGVKIFLQTEVKSVEKKENTFHIISDDHVFHSGRVLIACGGPAYPRLGGTDSGSRILSKFGHSIIPMIPALCPLRTDTRSISGLSGIRVRCSVKLNKANGTSPIKERGEVLFTDKGLSGICVMQTARFADAGDIIELNLVDRIIPDHNKLIALLLHRQRMFGCFPPETILNGILVPRLSYAVLKQAMIEMKGRTAGDLSYEEIRRISDKCRSYLLTVTGNCGMDEAQVTAGGADCNDFDPKNMQSRLVQGLFASGEVLNVDGDCGGFNLMFATASGILAGMNNRKETGI